MILAAEESHSEEIVNQVKAKNRSIWMIQSQKVASKMEKSEMEDWEVDDDDMNAAYKRVVEEGSQEVRRVYRGNWGPVPEPPRRRRGERR